MKTQAEATKKIREAMSGLRAAMKTASPEERKVIYACMSELRDIHGEIRAMDEMDLLMEEEMAPEAMNYMTEEPLPMEDEPLPMGMDESMGDPLLDTMDEFMDMEEEDPLLMDEEPMVEDALGEYMDMDEDEELALSALDLAAAALRAAAEEEMEEEEEEEDDSDSDDDSEEEAPPPPEGDEEDDEEMDDEGMDVLSEEDLAALEAEGLLEGSARQKIQSRLDRVEKRLVALLGDEGEGDGDALPF